ncbi:MAG: hypothetical protein ACHQQQ_10430 [Bacteroidota bacterium]
MAVLVVFYIHTVAAAAAFTRRYQEGGWGEGILGVAFVVLIFSVGWSMTTIFAHWLMEPKGFGIWFDRDAFALVLLTVLEAIFYIGHTRRKKRRAALTVAKEGN